MTHSSDKEDAQWLDAVAGRPDPAADPNVNREAKTVREALEYRARAMDLEVPEADSALKERILFQLRREKLFGLRSNRWSSSGLAVAASVVLGIAVMVDIGLRLQPTAPDDLVRGGPSSGVWVSQTPSGRLDDLIGDQTGNGVGLTSPSYAPVVAIKTDNPLETVQRITTEAVKAAVPIVVDQSDSGYRVLVDRLVPESPDQAALKQALGVSPSAAGTIIFLISAD